MEENMQSVSAPQQEEASVIPPSEFRGTTLQLIGWRLLGILLSIVTLGIGAPWAQCMVYRWEAKHTYVSGKQLHFDGKGHQLLGKYLLWGLLTLVTLGIYALFIPVRMHKWHAGHTRFAAPGNEAADTVSGAMIFGFVMAGVAGVLLIALLATLLLPRLTQNGKPALPDLDSFFDRITAKDEDPQYNEEEFFFGQEGVTSYIIDNGDGTFTVIYGNLPTGPAGDQSGNVWAEDTIPTD